MAPSVGVQVNETLKPTTALRPVDWSGNRFCFDVCDNKVGQLMDVKAVGL